LESLPKVAALKDGQSLVMESAQGVTFLRVLASQSAPVAEEAAVSRIQQFLANQTASEAVKATMKGLRASTNITYMGEFDNTKPAPDQGPGLLK
jgi:thioredoxin-like negative regulator of GroEL